MPNQNLEEALQESGRTYADAVTAIAGSVALGELRREAMAAAAERAKFAALMNCLPVHDATGQYGGVGGDYTCFVADSPAMFQRLRGSVLDSLNGQYMIVGGRPGQPKGKRPATDLLLWKVGEGHAAAYGPARRDDGGFGGQLRLVRTTSDAVEGCTVNMLERMTCVEEDMLQAAYDPANDTFKMGGLASLHFVSLRSYGKRLNHFKNFGAGPGGYAYLDAVDVPLEGEFQSCDQMIERYDMLPQLAALAYRFGTFEQLNASYEAVSAASQADL